jgi:hypothetical protein
MGKTLEQKSDEKIMKILDMLQAGTVTVAEATELIKAVKYETREIKTEYISSGAGCAY